MLLQDFHFLATKDTRYVATGTSGRRSIVHVWVSKPEPNTGPSADPSTESPAPALPTPQEGSVKFLTVYRTGHTDIYSSGFRETSISFWLSLWFYQWCFTLR
jgi:hypothetical protein